MEGSLTKVRATWSLSNIFININTFNHIKNTFIFFVPENTHVFKLIFNFLMLELQVAHIQIVVSFIL